MNTIDKLPELIANMTKSEKRYFKLFAQRHTLGKGNKYEVLFDAIEKQPEYDERQIMKRFKKDPMTNNFNVTKKRLYDQILLSLQQYHKDSSVTTELNSILSGVEILFKKGIYNQAEKKINAAKKLAEKNDQTAYLLLLIQWESKLHKTKSTKKKSHFFEELVVKEQVVVDQIQNRFQLENLKSKLIEMQKEPFTDSQVQKIDEAINEVNNIKSQNNSLIVQLETYSILALAYYIKGSKEAATKQLITKNNIYHQNPDRITNNPSDFMSDLANLIHLECSNNMFKEAREHLATLKSFPNKYKFNKTQNFDIRFFSTRYSLELSYNMYQFNFEEIVSKESAIVENLNKFGDKLSDSRKAYFHYMLAIANFYLGKYKNAKNHTSTITNKYANISDSKIRIYNKWLEIFVQVELGNYDLVNYKIATTKKYLKKKEIYSKADNDICLTLSKINESLSKVEINELLEKHLYKIETLSAQPTMKFSTSFFDYNAWMKSKTLGCSIKDQLKRA